MSDNYIEKEDNAKIKDVLIDFLTSSGSVQLNEIDSEDPEVSDYNMVPDTGEMAKRLRVCLQVRQLQEA